MDDCVIRVTGLKKSFPKGKEVLCVLKLKKFPKAIDKRINFNKRSLLLKKSFIILLVLKINKTGSIKTLTRVNNIVMQRYPPHSNTSENKPSLSINNLLFQAFE